MKKIILSLILLVNTAQIALAQIKSEVNECFELTSIVFRLADAQEYINNQVFNYTNDIDNYFAKYKNHKLILYTKEIRKKNRV